MGGLTQHWEVPRQPTHPFERLGDRSSIYFFIYLLFFSSPPAPRPQGFASPPIASRLCGLISLSKWHNPPGNLLVACGGEENH